MTTNLTEAVALKPCPFDGSMPVRVFVLGDVPSHIECKVCGIRHFSEQTWNTRHESHAQASRGDEEAETQLIEQRDAAQDAADEMASLILGEDIDWAFHDAKWTEAIEKLRTPAPTTEGQRIEVLREYAEKAARLNDADHIPGNTVKAHKMLMALAGMNPGYEASIDAALTQAATTGGNNNDIELTPDIINRVMNLPLTHPAVKEWRGGTMIGVGEALAGLSQHKMHRCSDCPNCEWHKDKAATNARGEPAPVQKKEVM